MLRIISKIFNLPQFLYLKLTGLKKRYLIQFNYRLNLLRLRSKIKNHPLRVVFYTNEPQKWSYDSVYWEFEKSKNFIPIVVVVPRYRVHLGKDHTRMSLEEQYLFYKERGYRVEYGYANGKYLDIKTFSPDIFFYLQLAEIPGVDDPYIVSKYALTAYCPYSYQLSDYKKHYLKAFHKLLYVNYMEHDLTLERFESYRKGNSKNCVNVGYPKLDVYLKNDIKNSNIWRDPSKFKIIYAPHHSFVKSEGNIFRWGTFQYNYKLILQLAEKTTDITTWVFKPHPMLKSVILASGIMDEKEMNEYYDRWSQIGRFCDSGDYFDIFRSSDLMITDCGSFLAEYLPSRKPLIRLVNDDGISLNKLGIQFSNCYYNAHNNDEFLYYFNEIVVKRNDYLSKERISKAESLIDRHISAAHKIFINLQNRIGHTEL